MTTTPWNVGNQTGYRPMGMGDILDRTIKSFTFAWKPLALAALIRSAPPALIGGLLTFFNATLQRTGNTPQQIVEQMRLSFQQGDFGIMTAIIMGQLVVLLAMLVVYPLAEGALVAISSYAFMGQRLSFRDALRISRSRYWSLLGTTLMIGLFTVLAIPAGIIGGLLILFFIGIPAALIALFTYTVFVSQAVIVEGTGGGWTAMRRSASLVGGRFWPLLGLGIVFTLMTSAMSGMLGLVTQGPVLIGNAFLNAPVLFSVLSLILGIIPTTLSACLTAVGLTVAYYDTRMRKEGLDLQWMTASHQNGQMPQ